MWETIRRYKPISYSPIALWRYSADQDRHWRVLKAAHPDVQAYADRQARLSGAVIFYLFGVSAIVLLAGIWL